MDNTTSSKAIEFLVFQITQNKHNGPKSHITFLFLPQRSLSNLWEFPSPNAEKPKKLQRKRGTKSTPPLFFRNEGEGG